MPMIKDEWREPYQSAETTQDTWLPFVKAMQALGFDALVTYVFTLTPVRSNSLIPDLSINEVTQARGNHLIYYMSGSPNDLKLHEIISTTDLIVIDPLAYHAVNEGTVAIVGKDFIKETDPNVKEATRFYELLEPVGVRNSLCIPIDQLNPWTPHGFGLHSSASGPEFEEAVTDNYDLILKQCYEVSRRFDRLYRKERSRLLGLSDRQESIIIMIAEGLSNREIASILDIKEATVSFHLKKIREILEIQTVREIPVAAIKLGLLSWE